MTKIALIGIGKIALDQHVPALAANTGFELVAGVSRHNNLDAVANFTSLDALLESGLDVDAVSICTPPQVRYEIARMALAAGLHTMLEKPPGATLNEVAALQDLAAEKGVALFGSWHSRESAGIAPAMNWLKGRRIEHVTINWKEDVRVWHPGQTWIWEAGGLGVFDPGINALSIITRLMPRQLVIEDAELSFPSNCQTPIAAELRLTGHDGVPVTMSLNFLQTGPPSWDIDIHTDDGSMNLSKGGAVLAIGGGEPEEAQDTEYPRLYEHFAALVLNRRVDVDVEPFRLVADAFLRGRRRIVEEFVE